MQAPLANNQDAGEAKAVWFHGSTPYSQAIAQPWKVPDNSKNGSSALLINIYYQEPLISQHVNPGQRQGVRSSL